MIRRAAPQKLEIWPYDKCHYVVSFGSCTLLQVAYYELKRLERVARRVDRIFEILKIRQKKKR